MMNVALAMHTLFAQAMLNPVLSISNIAFSATKINSNSGAAMVNTAVFGHCKGEPNILRTLVDTGACCTLIALSVFDEFIKGYSSLDNIYTATAAQLSASPTIHL